MGSKKVEDLILIKENKKQIEEFKEEFKDQLQDLDLVREPFRNFSVDTVLTIEDDEEDMFEVDVLEPGGSIIDCIEIPPG